MTLRIAIWCGLLTLGACSWVPDAVNPVKWYEGAADALVGDDEPVADAEDASFPSLGTVPEPPENVTSSEDFAAVAEGLAADRDNAQYTDDAIRRADDEVEGELVAQTEPVEEEATVSEIEPVEPAVAPEPEPMVVAEAASPPPAETLSGEPVTEVSALAPTAAQPLPGTADITALFNAAFEASAAKTLPQAAAVSYATASTATSVAPSSGYGAPGRFAGSVGFAEGSARLGGEAREVLLDIAYLYGATGGPIRIVGHASPTGSANEAQRKAANLGVALDRAVAVARELERLGVPAAKMTVEAQPEGAVDAIIIATDGAFGDRRVDVYLSQ
ncbi:MAG: hypothetical protein EXQ94_14730 [Alphaproteobacteria bacterium]|nr:hypothetical protein [Alphaproteobacteria bacterium]